MRMRPSDRTMLDGVRATGSTGLGIMLVTVVDSVVQLALPATLGAAIDSAIGAKPGVAAVVLACVLLGVASATEAAREVLERRTGVRSTLHLRKRLVHRMLSIGLERNNFSTGDLLGRTVESTAAAGAATSALATLGASVLVSVGGLVALFLIDHWLGVMFVVGAPVVWWLTRTFASRVEALTREYQSQQSLISGRYVDAMAGARSIRASGTTDREIARILAPLPELRAAGHSFWGSQRRVAWQLGILTPALQIGVLGIAGWGVLQARISPGELLAAQAYLGHATGLLKQSALVARIARASGAACRIADVLSKDLAAPGDRILPKGPGSLSLRGVLMTSRGVTVLSGLNLDVPAGRSVAVVGRSGTEKSTLADIASGLITPEKGQVLLDATPLVALVPGEAQRAIGYASSEPKMIGDTVADALAYSDEPPNSRRVDEGLRISDATQLVGALPDGLHTPLEELRLSGGEIQRLGLARALSRDARLVVLNDATSSVDTSTEARIHDRIEHALANTTRLIVTDRRSAAARADLVAWLDKGRIRALAPHRDLMVNREYRRIFDVTADREAPGWQADRVLPECVGTACLAVPS